jgi:hypothetical protein
LVRVKLKLQSHRPASPTILLHVVLELRSNFIKFLQDLFLFAKRVECPKWQFRDIVNNEDDLQTALHRCSSVPAFGEAAQY